MKFQPDQLDGVNVVSRLEARRIWVHQTPFMHSICVPWRGAVQAWGANAPADLTPGHFETLLAMRPELVIFGSGDKMRFVPPSLYRSLIERHIGLETMDTAAACRTYNVLATEGRKVVGAFLLDIPP